MCVIAAGALKKGDGARRGHRRKDQASFILLCNGNRFAPSLAKVRCFLWAVDMDT